MFDKRFLILVFFGIIFFFIGNEAIKSSLPEKKDDRVYAILQKHFPFKLEKRIGGFQIVDKITKEKIQPSNTEVFLLIDRKEKEWGKNHLKLEGDNLIVLDDQNLSIETITLQTQNEKNYVKNFFGL